MTRLIDIPFEEYILIDAVNKHSLDAVRQSPRKWEWQKTHPTEPTEAMIVGSATHCLTLEPDLFPRSYIVAPKIDKRTKAGKEEWSQFLEANAGKSVLTPEQMADIEAMAHVVRNHPVAKEYLEMDGVFEGTAITVDKSTGLKTKVRPDLYIGEPIYTAIDLKTARSVTERAIRYACLDYRYHVQAAFYMDMLNNAGVPCEDFIFIFVDKAAPNDVAVVRLDKASLALGRMEYMEDIQRLKDYLDGKITWNGPLGGNRVQEISLV